MKYMGSKSRIAKHIVPIIQGYIDNNNANEYIEPFVGGANVIDKIKCKTRKGSDLNKYLIALLCRVRDGKELYDKVSKELYDEARNAYNLGDTSSFEDWQVGNIGFIASFNGRWFDGGYAKTGYEKTKNGLRLRNYYEESKNNILTQAPKLKGIEFIVSDYRDIEITNGNTLIYCDPPYANTKKYANATQFNYDEFWQWCRKMSKTNIVIISEENAPDDFKCIWQQEVSRSIKAQDKSKSVEKLFIYNCK
nr:MAG TPA: DNA adenine methylase [Caudoviricetes sp.]